MLTDFTDVAADHKDVDVIADSHQTLKVSLALFRPVGQLGVLLGKSDAAELAQRCLRGQTEKSLVQFAQIAQVEREPLADVDKKHRALVFRQQLLEEDPTPLTIAESHIRVTCDMKHNFLQLFRVKN